MTRLERRAGGTLQDPLPIASLPFVETIDIEDGAVGPDEPSPCLRTATAAWYLIHPTRAGRLLIDLAGSTPLDPLVRLYRRSERNPATVVFLGCASPVWNAALSLATDVSPDWAYLAQVGTSESTSGRIVIRVGLDG
jgi:hypothetical protein